MAKILSMSKLAAELGVSKSTVCRALKDDPAFALETRRRIQEAAAKLGYRPNPLLSSIAAQRWAVADVKTGIPVALLVESRQQLESDDFGRMVEGIRHRAEERGFQLQVIELGDYRESHHLSNILFARGIQGIIVGPIRTPDQPLNLDWDQFSALSCGEDFFPPPLHKVQVNPRHRATLAFRTAVKLGYRRIGVVLLLHNVESPDDAARMGAFIQQQSRCDPHLPKLPFFLQGEEQPDPKRFRRWMEKARPDVLITVSPASVLKALATLDLRAPEDVGLISLFPLPGQEQITCVDGPGLETGVTAFDYLEHMIRTNQKGIPAFRRFIFIEAVLRKGSTTRRVGSPPPGLTYLLRHRKHGSYRHAVHSR